MTKFDDDVGCCNALKGGTLLRFNNGEYSDKDRNPIPIGTRLLVHELDAILQKWKGGEAVVIERDPVTGKLPDVDDLNDQIPRSEWELDLNGNPRPPWERTFRVFLLDPDTGQKFAFINATAGASMAFSDLKGAMQTKRFLHGVDLYPIVLLQVKQWKPEKFAARLRPYFHPVEWIQPGGGALAINRSNGPNGPKLIEGKAAAKPVVSEINPPDPPEPPEPSYYDDSIPF
jgi:hypothetical protein